MVFLLFPSGQSSGSQSVDESPWGPNWILLDLVVWVLAFCTADTPVNCVSYYEPSGVLVIFTLTSSTVCGVDRSFLGAFSATSPPCGS